VLFRSNVGWEHRNEHQFFNPDSAETSGQLSGFGSAAVPIDATDAVTEYWGELRAPLVQDKSLAQDLIFDTGYRHSNYTYSGGINTYKFELQWAPIRDIRFRGTYQQAIRAPSLIELFNPQLVGLIQFGNDPCAGTAPTATLAQCQAQGVTAAQYGHIPQCVAGQCSQLTGGNPALNPETSKSWTAGFTFTPQAVPTLSGSIDYYHIALGGNSTNGEVGTLPARVIMADCLATLTQYCDQIVRQPNTGSLTGNALATGGYIKQTDVNIGAALVSGIDLQATYKLNLSCSTIRRPRSPGLRPTIAQGISASPARPSVRAGVTLPVRPIRRRSTWTSQSPGATSDRSRRTTTPRMRRCIGRRTARIASSPPTSGHTAISTWRLPIMR